MGIVEAEGESGVAVAEEDHAGHGAGDQQVGTHVELLPVQQQRVLDVPLHNPRLRCPEGHLAIDGVVLEALGLGLEGSSFLLAPEQKDAFALVGGSGLADPYLGFIKEGEESLSLFPDIQPVGLREKFFHF